MRRERVAIESLKASGLGTDLTANDWSQLEATAERLLSDGWSALDVRTYLRCTEELNPELSEQVALARMSQIEKKYKGESKMVERAGTGPGINDDTDLFDPEQKAAKASRKLVKPKVPDDIGNNYEAQKQYVRDLATYYATRMDLSDWDSAERAMEMLALMFEDGFRVRELVV